jgi:hypothetical protein
LANHSADHPEVITNNDGGPVGREARRWRQVMLTNGEAIQVKATPTLGRGYDSHDDSKPSGWWRKLPAESRAE